MNKCKHGRNREDCCECRYGSKFDENGDFVEQLEPIKDLVDIFKESDKNER